MCCFCSLWILISSPCCASATLFALSFSSSLSVKPPETLYCAKYSQYTTFWSVILFICYLKICSFSSLTNMNSCRTKKGVVGPEHGLRQEVYITIPDWDDRSHISPACVFYWSAAARIIINRIRLSSRFILSALSNIILISSQLQIIVCLILRSESRNDPSSFLPP